MAKKRGLVYLWTGEGAGKTTSALGVALRCVGHRKNVVMIQFLKGRKDIGEYKIQRKLSPYYSVYQFGGTEFIDPKNPSPDDFKRAKKGLEFAKHILKTKPFLLILDEINLITGPKTIHGKRYKGLLDVKDVISFLNSVPRQTIVYLTGRYAPKKLINRADFVNEIVLVKQPRKKIPPTKGIEY